MTRSVQIHQRGPCWRAWKRRAEIQPLAVTVFIGRVKNFPLFSNQRKKKVTGS